MPAKSARAVLIFPLLITLLLAAGCGSVFDAPPVDTTAMQEKIVGKTWICESLFERDVPEEANLFIEFLGDGTLRGSGGCNNFTAQYTLDGDSITITSPISTKKACGAVTAEREYTFFTFLPKINRVQADGDELSLFTSEAVNPILFVEKGSSLW